MIAHDVMTAELITANPEIGRSGVPTFSSIAKRREQSFDGAMRWLGSVPDIMPNHHVAQGEILDLATYIMSLRPALD